MIHQLKTVTKYFDAIADGTKTFEVRKNDRDFKVNDFLALNEFDGTKETGRCMLVEVTYVLKDREYCKDKTVIMGISLCGIFKLYDDRGGIPVYGKTEK